MPGKDVKSLGKSIINRRKNEIWKKQANTQYAGLHVADAAVDGGAGKLQSVTDRHELDEFLCDALLKETEFEVQHSSTVILTNEAIVKPKGDFNLFEYETIQIPRRPHWDASTTAEELDRSERESFLRWRRDLADQEELAGTSKQLTPFEKNLEVWKQLWRVLERSHIVFQVIDARNPLLFRCKDLEAYVKELSEQQQQQLDRHGEEQGDKTCLLVINKADYLTPTARRAWAHYFDKHGIDFVFWSAALEQQRLDRLEKEKRRRERLNDYHGHSVERVDSGRIRGLSSEEEEDEDEPTARGKMKGKGNQRKQKSKRKQQQQQQQEREVEMSLDEEDAEKTKALKASNLWQALEGSVEEEQVTDAVSNLSVKPAPPSASPSNTAAQPNGEAATSADASSSDAAAASASVSASAAAADPVPPSGIEPLADVTTADTASAPASSSSSTPAAAPSHSSSTRRRHAILSREELFDYVIEKYVRSNPANKARYERGEKITVGLTGYPNVGKSSTINVLAGSKKVTVGATPGKTKHFQTIPLQNSPLVLCDCPGLVFPTFLSSRAELVCNGIMPIDTIRDWSNILAPVQLLCEKVSRAQWQQVYALVFPDYKPVSADALLASYARLRGFYKDHGRPDEAHAARIILKDFCAGKVLYAHPPPELMNDERRRFYQSFHVANQCLINENLWIDEEEQKRRKEELVMESVEALAGQHNGKDNTDMPMHMPAASSSSSSSSSTSVQHPPLHMVGEEEVEDGGITAARRIPVATKKKQTTTLDEGTSDSEDDGDDEDEDDDGDTSLSDSDSLQHRPVRSTRNAAALNAQLLDDLSDVVLPSSTHMQTTLNKQAAKLAQQGLNPDGTPMTMKQIYRLNQREKKRKGKAHKMRKHQVPMNEVGVKTGGRSADAAARLGAFHA